MDKVLVFYDHKFPGMEEKNFNLGKRYCMCDAASLKDELKKEYDVFISMHGSYFPLHAAEEFFAYLKSGKGYVHMTDTPLEYLCTFCEAENKWLVGERQMSYYRKLNIHSVLEVGQQDVAMWRENLNNPVAKKAVPYMQGCDTRNYIMIPTKNKYVEEEWGSVGSMDAKIIPLIKGYTGEEEHISSPVVLIENRAGDYRGGRWIFINGALGRGCDLESVLEPMVSYVSTGYREIMVKPSMPLYYEGEKATVKIQIENFDKLCNWDIKLSCSKNSILVFGHHSIMEAGNYATNSNTVLECPLSPGIYHLVAELRSDDGEIQIIDQGFCVYDKSILENAVKTTCGKDYFVIDGKPCPVVGTTYMSSQVSRAFLQLPNPAEWLADMEDMKKQGINWVRTGMWCNWRNYMLDDGHFEEFILRSIDAFIQTAAYVGLQVTFTFFTFVPEPFEGTHPYLDPRSVDAQRRFISNVVCRHKYTSNVDWDLINEPFTTDHPTQKKFDADTWEKKDFSDYMEKQYGSFENMLECLDLTVMDQHGFEELMVPNRSSINFDITDMGDSKNGLIWRDYIKYTISMFSNWVEVMKGTIKEISPSQMVTVGQDEALKGQRPTPLLYGGLLDYNCQHTWWLLDDLVWDTRFTKYFGKPLLVQETGIMYAELPNGQPRRTEKDIAKLLQKKYAYAYGTKCAGAIHWIWNTNYYLKSANESNIGAIRCDGSKKPEFFIYRKYAEFFRGAGSLVTDTIDDEEIAVIFPFSNDFSNRNFAGHGTSQITKILTYHLKRRFVGISEFDLEPLLLLKPKLVIVPSAHHFEDTMFLRLMEIVGETGTTVVFTGPIARNEYFRGTERAYEYIGAVELEPLAKYEELEYKGEVFAFSFDQNYVSRAFKERGQKGYIEEAKVGKGKLIWCGIPLELSSETRETAKFYKSILEEVGSKEEFTLTGTGLDALFVSKINWEKGSLYTIVNEANLNRKVCLMDITNNTEYSFEVEGDGSVLFAVQNGGDIVSVYNHEEIQVHRGDRNESNRKKEIG